MPKALVTNSYKELAEKIWLIGTKSNVTKSEVLNTATFYDADSNSYKQGTIPSQSSEKRHLTNANCSTTLPAGYYSSPVTVDKDNTSAIVQALNAKLPAGTTANQSMTNAELADLIRQISQKIEVRNVQGTITYTYHKHDTATKSATSPTVGNSDGTRNANGGANGCWSKGVYHVHSQVSTTAESYLSNQGNVNLHSNGNLGCYCTEIRHHHDGCHKEHTGNSTSGGGCYGAVTTTTCPGRYHVTVELDSLNRTYGYCAGGTCGRNSPDKDFYFSGGVTWEGRACTSRVTTYSLNCGKSVCGMDENQYMYSTLSCTKSQSVPFTYELDCGWSDHGIASAQIVFPKN